jgi:cell division transport system ATP-binding protein
MRLLYRINRTGTTVLVATHDQAMVDRMRRRVLELSHGRIVRDEQIGRYARDETTREFARRMRSPSTLPPGIDVVEPPSEADPRPVSDRERPPVSSEER